MKFSKMLLFLTTLSFAATFLIYEKLPEQIPVHWGIDGQVDRYGGKSFAFVTGALPLLIYILMLVIPKIDPRRENYEKHSEAYKIVRNFLIIFLAGLHWATMAYSLGYNIDMVFLVKLSVGVLFMAIGNFMPVIKPNYLFGIRLPWTLANDIVWEKTHRLGGYIFVLLGVIWFGLAFVDYSWLFYVMMGSLVAALVTISVYSYLIFRQIKK